MGAQAAALLTQTENSCCAWNALVRELHVWCHTSLWTQTFSCTADPLCCVSMVLTFLYTTIPAALTFKFLQPHISHLLYFLHIYLLSLLASSKHQTAAVSFAFLVINILSSTKCFSFSPSAPLWQLAPRQAESSQIDGRKRILIGEQYLLVEAQPINEMTINYLFA